MRSYAFAISASLSMACGADASQIALQPNAPEMHDAGSTTWGTTCRPTPGDDDPGVVPRPFLDMVIAGAGFIDREGMVLRVRTHKWDEESRVFAAAEAVVQSAAVRLTWPHTYERFSYQPVLMYIDVDGDGRCDPSADDVFSMVTSAWNPRDNADLVIDIDPDFVQRVGQNQDREQICAQLNRC